MATATPKYIKNKKRNTIIATSYHKFTGKARFIKVYEPDDFMGAKNFKAGLYPDEDSMLEFQKSGIQKGVKEDENGKYFEVTRAQIRTFDEEITKFSPPVIYGKDGSVQFCFVNENDDIVRSWRVAKEKAPTQKGERILIGNGSDIEVTVAVFDTRKGKGQRLESIKILDLIEYKKPEIVTDADLAAVEEPQEEVAVKKPKGKAPW